MPTRFYRDSSVQETAKVRTLMEAIASVLVWGGLMIAVVAFFWAAGRARKQTEDAQEAADTAAQTVRTD